MQNIYGSTKLIGFFLGTVSIAFLSTLLINYFFGIIPEQSGNLIYLLPFFAVLINSIISAIPFKELKLFLIKTFFVNFVGILILLFLLSYFSAN